MLQGVPLEIHLAVSRTASGLPPDIEWVVAAWLLMIGGCFGSLMNVIVYRWPAGMSIVLPGSRCPRCLHPIRLYDNIPVLSWIVLGARCRDCRVPIPVRYPLVEAAIAVLFFSFFIVEVINGGANLPDIRGHESNVRAMRDPQILWGIYGLHMLLGYVLISAALIEFDGSKLPAKLIWPPLLVAIVATVCWPELRPASAGSDLGFDNGWREGLFGVVAGAVVGGIGGRLADAASMVGRGGDRRWSCTCLAIIVGAIVGWFAAAAICLAACVFISGAKLERRLRSAIGDPPASYYLAVVTLLFLLYWRFIDEVARRPFN